MTQPDLFTGARDWVVPAWNSPQPSYPAIPGYKAPGTSQDAALARREGVEVLRDRVLGAIRQRDSTADEVAEQLGESILSVRPRVSELRCMGRIEATGARRLNESRRAATVWRARE